MQTTLQTEPRPELLTTDQAAAVLGIKANSLITWRSTKAVKIPFVRIGAAVRYRKSDLDAFLAENLQEG